MIKFVDEDVSNINEIIKKGYEEIMNVTVKEGDPVNDFISWIAYIISISKNEINYTGKMNLLRYATGQYLEALGEIVGVSRIKEKGAKATVKYTFSKIFTEVVVIPKGHKIASGSVYFEADEDVQLKINERETIGTVTCITPGTIGNDIPVGELNTIVDDVPFLLSVKNLTITNGGVDEESDEGLRNRIQLKPTAFSTAGPVAAYKYYTLTAYQDIVDVYIYTPNEEPGVVKIIPLLKNGEIPESEVLDVIKEVLDDEVRPFTDKVEVLAPTAENYSINLKWWLNKGDDVTIITNQVQNAIQDFISWQSLKLGRDINPNKLIQLLISAGAKRVEIESPLFTKIDKTKVAINQGQPAVNYQGVEEE